MRRRNEKGWMPVETAILVTVLALLIGIGVTRYRQAQNETTISKAVADLKTLQAAVESYMIHNKEYPVQTQTPAKSWQTALLTADPPMLGSISMDPFSPSTEYRYATDAAKDSKFYVLFSVGPDGRAGITGVSPEGKILGRRGDDICVSNGTPLIE